MTLQQIQRGKAFGSKAALYSRSFIQRCLFWLGCYVQRKSFFVISVIMMLFSLSCYGLQYVKIETDIVKLWVAKGGRLDAELTYLSNMETKYGKTNWTESDDLHWIREQTDEKLANLAQEKPSEGGYQVVIQTAESDHENILTRDGLLRHVDLVSEIAGLAVNVDGFNWTLRDICFKPGGIDPAKMTSDVRDYAPILEKLMPCVWITPLDCFWEGAKPIGPDPPLTSEELGLVAYLLNTAHDLPVSWSTFNPEEVVKLFKDIADDMGTLASSFETSGIGQGYIDRHCIDPYNPDCPSTARNAFDYCKYFNKYKEYLNSTGQKFHLQPDRFDPYMLNSESCTNYRRSFMTMIRNKSIALEFMTEDELPKLPDYGSIMKGGCRGFARNILRWPQDMIIGGAKEELGRENTSITADALQTVFLVASSEDLYKRFKDSPRLFSYALYEWTPRKAEEVILTWQRAFTKRIYNHPLNFLKNDTTSAAGGASRARRIIHPLASTSMADMLEEFCQFNYTVIFVGYFLMLMYAIYSQMKRDGYCLLNINSSMGLGFAGVLTVTYASISGLGLATWLGIEFNAATTQIVPFLTLGIGVDNMFMLLHNYHEVTSNVKKNEIGVLMKETGMSILMTSINNILSFLAGTLLPIPALRSFCAQDDPEVKIAYSLLCSYGESYDCYRAEWVSLVDDVGNIREDGFYNYLHAWYEYESMLYAVSQATFYPVPRKLRQGAEDKYLYYVPPTKKIVYSQIPFYLSGLTDTPVIVEMIKEIRGICDEYQALGIDTFPHGIAFTFWEQYLHLNDNLMNAISIIMAAVFCVISLLLFNPWAASCIMLILILMTVELAGFLGFVGIKLNPVSAVTLITAVGIGVEFTAHVVFAFLTSLGDRNERMAAAIDRVFVPVIHGALSTLLGIVMLAFSEFEFVVKYFFVVMFALIIIGLINGLALLPVLLSLMGPSCEIRPCEGNKKRLSVPPSIRERNNIMAGHR
ncbi:hypothetical protein QR680_001624 [Steinernema hermaphroditum]|uniref:SSD domain-containing protein n=1 Tax=Steinernema hermaphroditum TaxID=289476 RepID=A0AA39GZ76_9BILA|nr:hypothetical protein QR680_001624 [Steinernema hermaphroditum]